MKERVSLLAWLGLFCLFPFVQQSEYLLQLATQLLIFVLLFIGVDMAVGHGGLMSVCHGALFGMGAYATGILMSDYGWGFYSTIGVGVVSAAGAGLIVGLLTLKLEGHYFVIGTLAFALLMTILAQTLDITHGELGITNIPRPALGLLETAIGPARAFYCLALACVLFGVAFYILVIESFYGRQLRAMRDNPMLAECLGVNLITTKLLVFVISAAIAAIAGSLQATFLTYISPQISSHTIGFTALLALIVGGRGLIGGAIIGAVLFTILPEILREVQEFQSIALGIIIIVIIQRMPEGIYPWVLRKARALLAGKG